MKLKYWKGGSHTTTLSFQLSDMKNVCIITDSSVQFPKPNFIGREMITIIPLDIYYKGHLLSEEEQVRPNQLPRTASEKDAPHLISPDPEYIRKVLINLSQQAEILYGIFLSKEFTPMFDHACQAANSLKGKIDITIIDSKTTSVGLGLLIQKLVERILSGEYSDHTDRYIRNMISRLYTLVCTPSLSYLHHNGFIERTQSILSEMLGIIPIFTLEDGFLSPIEKVKSIRHALSYFHEFIEEFEEIEHIAYIQSAKPNFKEGKIFHDNIMSTHVDVTFTKHLINLPLSMLFGPRSNFLFILENR